VELHALVLLREADSSDFYKTVAKPHFGEIVLHELLTDAALQPVDADRDAQANHLLPPSDQPLAQSYDGTVKRIG